MIRRQFHLTDKQTVALRRLAKQLGLSASEIIRRALDAFLKEQKQ